MNCSKGLVLSWGRGGWAQNWVMGTPPPPPPNRSGAVKRWADSGIPARHRLSAFEGERPNPSFPLSPQWWCVFKARGFKDLQITAKGRGKVISQWDSKIRWRQVVGEAGDWWTETPIKRSHFLFRKVWGWGNEVKVVLNYWNQHGGSVKDIYPDLQYRQEALAFG